MSLKIAKEPDPGTVTFVKTIHIKKWLLKAKDTRYSTAQARSRALKNKPQKTNHTSTNPLMLS